MTDALGGAWGASWGGSWGGSWGRRARKPSGGGSLGFFGQLGARRRPVRTTPETASADKLSRFARELTGRLEADAVSAEKAADIAKRAERFKTLLIESVVYQEYLAANVAALIDAARQAAAIENERQRQAQLLLAAEIAARIEADLRDEEDALILLMM